LALAPGSRLGPYEIVVAIGAGAMGEVYRARDTKLNRDVALKILPEAFTSDPDRLARFRREAQVLASLNHPHIGQIYGFEDSGATHALAMEFVDGEDLAQRIARGPLPLDEALPIARQIADALEAAHEQGIVHRDLKPGNIKVRADGTVKVLDFGLAKSVEPVVAASGSVSMAPTLTTPAMTQAGMILGTAAYMSPEQATGKSVDKRADIWAFGVVLWEMMTGRRPFNGETVSHVLASVLKDEPDWMALPAGTPAAVRRLLTRCLDKDRKRRLDSAAAVRLDIDEALARPTTETNGASSPAAAASRGSGWRVALPWGLAAVLGAGLAVTLMKRTPSRSAGAASAIRLTADVDEDLALKVSAAPMGAVALSPDGRLLAFSAQASSAASHLYVRRLDQLRATALAGTEDAHSPFFSPDGQWIAFFTSTHLKKISITGGAAMAICEAGSGRGGTWGEDGTIVFTPSGKPGAALMRVPDTGGTPTNLTTPAVGLTERWPQLLPGGRAVMFSAAPIDSNFDAANVVVQLLSGGSPKVLQRGGTYGRYVASGHLLYVHGGTLFVAPFDLDRLEVTGRPSPVVEAVNASDGTGAANFAVANNGTLVYFSGQTGVDESPILWLDRSGRTAPLRATPSDWGSPRFSPDGSKLAIDIARAGNPAIWVYDWSRDTTTRVTSGANAVRPVWTPDGHRLVFTSARDGGSANLFWQRADGTGDTQRLTTSASAQYAGAWHPNGKILALTEINPQTKADIMTVTMEGDESSGWKPGKPAPFANSPSAEQDPAFSPDGRWIAYSSDESGRPEIYVRPYPSSAGKWPISGGGGTLPVWSRTRPELFYSTLDQQLMVVSFRVDGVSFVASKPQLWSPGRFMVRPRFSSYDLHPDGDRFALVTPQSAPVNQDKIVFVLNFFDELKRVAPIK